MVLKESAPIHLVDKTPIEDRNRYSFVFPVDAYPHPRRIMLQQRNPYRDGGGYIGCIGGKYQRYRLIGNEEATLEEHVQVGMLREFEQETGLKARRIIHQSRIWWNGIKQGWCTGEVFYVVVEDLTKWNTSTPEEGWPYIVDVPQHLAVPRMLPMVNYILTQTLGVEEFMHFEVPQRNTTW